MTPIVERLRLWLDYAPLAKPPYDRIREATDNIEELVEALTKCRDKFCFYEQLHRLKCTAEGDEKADRNREMADMCDGVLDKIGGDA